jgi:hypothetical protein
LALHGNEGSASESGNFTLSTDLIEYWYDNDLSIYATYKHFTQCEENSTTKIWIKLLNLHVSF